MPETNPESEIYWKQTVEGKALVKVLWTGGFDSTYRMVELSRHDVIVQPYYLSDKIRRSKNLELRAMSEISEDIENDPGTRCRILPLIINKASEFKPDRRIVEAWKRLRNSSNIGTQYVWLAQFAKSNPGMEICIERGSSCSGTSYCIRQNGKLREINDSGLIYRVLDQDNSNTDILALFGSMHFPIIHLSKMEMLENYRNMGFSKVMEKTWFCHTPINGETCGVCNPCKQAIEKGLGFKVSAAGLKRNELELKYQRFLWFKIWKKFRYRIYGY